MTNIDSKQVNHEQVAISNPIKSHTRRSTCKYGITSLQQQVRIGDQKLMQNTDNNLNENNLKMATYQMWNLWFVVQSIKVTFDAYDFVLQTAHFLCHISSGTKEPILEL